MKILSRPSPNFNDRKLPLNLLVLHYTGMETGEAAIERLCDSNAEVSAHYVVGEDGNIIQLVDDHARAWHAGVSNWRGITDVNSASIGIEIVNGGHDYGLPEFEPLQILSVIQLCRKLMLLHNITADNIIGHSDIASGRKLDPGEKFPWPQLAKSGVGIWPNVNTDDRRSVFETGARDRGVAIAQLGLADIGYGVEVSGVLDAQTEGVIRAFQRRYRPDQIDGRIDVQTMALIVVLVEAHKSLRARKPSA